jgi:hypothetical protein
MQLWRYLCAKPSNQKNLYTNIQNKSLNRNNVLERGVFIMGLETVVLAVIIGTLLAIVYSLRILVLMERRVARIDMHLEALINKVLIEEKNIESEEKTIEKQEIEIEKVLGIKSKPKAKLLRKHKK